MISKPRVKNSWRKAFQRDGPTRATGLEEKKNLVCFENWTESQCDHSPMVKTGRDVISKEREQGLAHE